jgi:hypothetical protein
VRENKGNSESETDRPILTVAAMMIDKSELMREEGDLQLIYIPTVQSVFVFSWLTWMLVFPPRRGPMSKTLGKAAMSGSSKFTLEVRDSWFERKRGPSSSPSISPVFVTCMSYPSSSEYSFISNYYAVLLPSFFFFLRSVYKKSAE